MASMPFPVDNKDSEPSTSTSLSQSESPSNSSPAPVSVRPLSATDAPSQAPDPPASPGSPLPEKYHGFIGSTPDFHGFATRAEEILFWLQQRVLSERSRDLPTLVPIYPEESSDGDTSTDDKPNADRLERSNANAIDSNNQPTARSASVSPQSYAQYLEPGSCIFPTPLLSHLQSFVILDDMNVLADSHESRAISSLIRPHFVRTNDKVGFSEADRRLAEQILNNTNFQSDSSRSSVFARLRRLKLKDYTSGDRNKTDSNAPEDDALPEDDDEEEELASSAEHTQPRGQENESIFVSAARGLLDAIAPDRDNESKTFQSSDLEEDDGDRTKGVRRGKNNDNNIEKKEFEDEDAGAFSDSSTDGDVDFKTIGREFFKKS